jgi:hypothetical protein
METSTTKLVTRWRVEIRGIGVASYLFETKQEAANFGLASFGQYRVYSEKVRVAS